VPLATTERTSGLAALASRLPDPAGTSSTTPQLSAVAMLCRAQFFVQIKPIAMKEISDLRRKYRSAYTMYMHCVHELADASQRSIPLAPDIEAAEEKAFNELAHCRRALLDALHMQTKKSA
jgi:hypothetical protein